MSQPSSACTCRLCGRPCLDAILDLGLQPICNRFMHSPQEPQTLFPMALCFCPQCALPQIQHPVPAGEVKPRFDWITYREAEPHLDDMVDRAIRLSGAGHEATIGGLTYKDTSTLDRFRAKGFAHVWQIAPRTDLGTPTDRAEVETVQDRLNTARASEIVMRHGACDILIARHMLEHSHDSLELLRAVTILLKPNGIVVFEVPDFARCMEGCDYATIWEEHILYFNRATLPATVGAHGFDVLESYEHPYSLENAVITIARPTTPASPVRLSNADRDHEAARWKRYVDSFTTTRERVRNTLLQLRGKHGAIALFGAGHLSAKFINLYEVADVIDFVADNDPNKIGLFMAGSGLPILPSDELTKRNVGVCLLGLSPESENKVRSSHRSYTDHGGCFMSIFPSNPSCFLNANAS